MKITLCTPCRQPIYPTQRDFRGENGEHFHHGCIPTNMETCPSCHFAVSKDAMTEDLSGTRICTTCYPDEPCNDPPGFEDGFCANH